MHVMISMLLSPLMRSEIVIHGLVGKCFCVELSLFSQTIFI